MLTLSEPKLSASVADFGRYPNLFNFENGTLDLQSGELQAHKREDLLTQIAPQQFNADAETPTWRAFMDDIIPDIAVQAFVWKSVGYSMTGDIGEQVLFFLHGGGANGKSTFVEALAYMLGDYAASAPPGS